MCMREKVVKIECEIEVCGAILGAQFYVLVYLLNDNLVQLSKVSVCI